MEKKTRSRQKGTKSPCRTGGQQPQQCPQFGVAFGLGLEVDDVRHHVPPWWIGALSAVPPLRSTNADGNALFRKIGGGGFYFAEPVVLGVHLRVSLRTAELIG